MGDNIRYCPVHGCLMFPYWLKYYCSRCRKWWMDNEIEETRIKLKDGKEKKEK